MTAAYSCRDFPALGVAGELLPFPGGPVFAGRSPGSPPGQECPIGTGWLAGANGFSVADGGTDVPVACGNPVFSRTARQGVYSWGDPSGKGASRLARQYDFCMPPVTPAGVLAGRAYEMTLLEGLLGDLTRGGGAAVLIEGEPGIGKTALARAAIAAWPAGGARHGRGFQVFWGTGDELGQELPLLPFLDALAVRRPSAGARRSAIAGLLRGEVPAGRSADVPAMLAEQLIALTIDEAATRPVVLVIDDLQWADPATVQLWGRLARTSGQVPLLLIGASRPVPQREDLLALRRALDDGRRIRLSALPQPAVAELVGALAGGRPDAGLLRLAAGAAGNPLYLTELAGALTRAGGIAVTPAGAARLTAVAVPSSLPGAIADRVGFVSPSTRQVLRAAALLGVEFTLTDLAAVLAETVPGLAAAIGEAHAAGVLIDDGGGLAFRHPLIREALYQEVPPSFRAARHRHAGQALAAACAPPDRVARQLLRAVSRGVTGADADGGGRADDPVDGWLLDWLDGTADALVAQVPQMAAELLARAVPGVQPGSARHGWLLSRLATALYRTGDWPAARQAAERGLATAADPDTAVDCHCVIVQCGMHTGPPGGSLAGLERALAAPGISARQRGRLLALAARTCLADGQVTAGSRYAARAHATAKEAGDTWAAAWALHVLAAAAYMAGRLADTLPLYDQALAVTTGDPVLDDLGLLLQINRSSALAGLGREEEALRAVDQARRRADQIGSTVRSAQAHAILCALLFEAGRWDDALAAAAAVPTEAKEPGAACTDLGASAVIAFHRGKPAEGRRLLTSAEPAARRLGQRQVGPLLLARALEREHAGAPDAALAILAEAFSGNAEDPGEFDELLVDAVRLATETGDKDTAQMLAGRAVAGGPGARPARALHCQGMADQNTAALAAAARLYADRGRPLSRAQALEAAARIHAEGGDLAQARPTFEQAAEVYELLGAEADLNRLHAEFRALGMRRGPRSTHRRAVSGWESLTGTELKVAAFVEEGLSNPEIAARLMLSRRTIATHVSHILGKLNVTSRIDVARESARRGAAGE
jgi:DNA-binding CsgD family transcriptional regulator